MTNEEFGQLINQIVTEKTFSLEAIDGIKKLKEELDTTKTTLELAKTKDKEISKIANDRYEQINSLNKSLEDMKVRLVGIEDREKKMNRLEIQAEFNNNRGNEMKEIVMALVRNPKYTRSESGFTPLVLENGQYSSGSSFDKKVSETVEKTKMLKFGKTKLLMTGSIMPRTKSLSG